MRRWRVEAGTSISQEWLDALAGASKSAFAATRAAALTRRLLEQGDSVKALEALSMAESQADKTLSKLAHAGVAPNVRFPSIYFSLWDTPTYDASQMNTDLCALIDGVQALTPLAEKIDKARGYWYPDAPATDTRGTDLAESLHQFACRLRLEAEGLRDRE